MSTASNLRRLAARLEASPEGECNGHRCVLIPAQVLAEIVRELNQIAKSLDKDWTVEIQHR